MNVFLPVYSYVGVHGFQMFPGTGSMPGIQHELIPGLHLVAGVNGLGKSTLVLILYHGLVGPAAIRNDDFEVPLPEVIARRDVERFRHRVADAARDAQAVVRFNIGTSKFEVTRSLYDLSLLSWKKDGIDQVLEEDLYQHAVCEAMSVGTFADVLIILNLIVFMFEDRGLLMWSPLAQRNVLRALFTSPNESSELARRAQAVSAANSAYRNLLYFFNKDRKKLEKDQKALASSDVLNSEYTRLLENVSANDSRLLGLFEQRTELDQARTDARTALETAKFNYDDLLREIEALKLARVASVFPETEETAHYVLVRLIGDKECLACGANGGPLIDRWLSAVSKGDCVLCGADNHQQEVIVPPVQVDTVRLQKAEARLANARLALEAANQNVKAKAIQFEKTQSEIDQIEIEQAQLRQRSRQIAGALPPSPPVVAALAERLEQQAATLEALRRDQKEAEAQFSQIFDQFRISVERKADQVREAFGRRISEFLVEKAEISLGVIRSPIGESGQSYDWPTFQLSMTSGTFHAPAPRRRRSEVSMSQGEFIDLAFRLALVNVASESSPATMVFDAPEASLDALFMRRAGAFLSQFTQEHAENRLVVTSNLTNADMIPALFGAYKPQKGDPQPQTIPRSERTSRVINLLALAAPTSAVELVGDRYKNLLDKALFPPRGEARPGL